MRALPWALGLSLLGGAVWAAPPGDPDSALLPSIEDGDLPLEQSLALFEEGVALSRAGSARLDAAERRIEELLSDRPLELRPLDPEG